MAHGELTDFRPLADYSRASFRLVTGPVLGLRKIDLRPATEDDREAIKACLPPI